MGTDLFISILPPAIGRFLYFIVVELDSYIYLCPFIENDNEIFLKTIYPSRKLTKIYLKNEGDLKNGKKD